MDRVREWIKSTAYFTVKELFDKEREDGFTKGSVKTRNQGRNNKKNN